MKLEIDKEKEAEKKPVVPKKDGDEKVEIETRHTRESETQTDPEKIDDIKTIEAAIAYVKRDLASLKPRDNETQTEPEKIEDTRTSEATTVCVKRDFSSSRYQVIAQEYNNIKRELRKRKIQRKKERKEKVRKLNLMDNEKE